MQLTSLNDWSSGPKMHLSNGAVSAASLLIGLLVGGDVLGKDDAVASAALLVGLVVRGDADGGGVDGDGGERVHYFGFAAEMVACNCLFALDLGVQRLFSKNSRIMGTEHYATSRGGLEKWRAFEQQRSRSRPLWQLMQEIAKDLRQVQASSAFVSAADHCVAVIVMAASAYLNALICPDSPTVLWC
ncbi:hypothetical protein DFP72DRAFT_847849 [Ephemerocybe angulata]|uniref:Uncharacterized protein n=1 Tax=Ephemerocybe angulata TaxID=980116 RepID=A0A8H6HXA9_9AGAR|nr:hypothetical protein DFP72DRAFT_847849 [Tulosesus angulatus]